MSGERRIGDRDQAADPRSWIGGRRGADSAALAEGAYGPRTLKCQSPPKGQATNIRPSRELVLL